VNSRQEANLKIADILMETIWERDFKFGTALKEFAEACPQQRAGQIICNYICGDYREENPSPETTAFMAMMFPGNPDPFFEESVVTLERLNGIL